MLRREWDRLVHSVENHSLGVAEQNGLFIACMGLAGLFGTTQYLSIKKLKDETRRISTALKAVKEQAARRNGAWHNLELKADTLEAKHNSMVDAYEQQARQFRDFDTRIKACYQMLLPCSEEIASLRGNLESYQEKLQSLAHVLQQQIKQVTEIHSTKQAAEDAKPADLSGDFRLFESETFKSLRHLRDRITEVQKYAEKNTESTKRVESKIKQMEDVLRGIDMDKDMTRWFASSKISEKQTELENQVSKLYAAVEKTKGDYTEGMHKSRAMALKIEGLLEKIEKMEKKSHRPKSTANATLNEVNSKLQAVQATIQQLSEEEARAYNRAQGQWKTCLPMPHRKREGTDSGSSSSTSTSTASDFTNDSN